MPRPPSLSDRNTSAESGESLELNVPRRNIDTEEIDPDAAGGGGGGSSESLMSDDEPPAPLPHMESSEEELQLDRRNVATTELDVPGEAESSSTLGGPSFGRGGSAASVGSLGSQASDASGQMRI